MSATKPCAYLFLDEAGDFDFSPTGSPYFILTSVRMNRPFPIFSALETYKYDCLEFGVDLEYFHCAEDNRHIRSRVFDLIGLIMHGIEIDFLIIDKRKIEPALREDRRFYPETLGRLLSYVLPRLLDDGAAEVIVITDTIPVHRKRSAIEKGVQLALGRMLPANMPYRILHHSSRAHYGLQIADYCCWALHRKLQTGDDSFYRLISPAIRSERDIFRAETLRYY